MALYIVYYSDNDCSPGFVWGLALTHMWEHLHCRIISVRGDACGHKANLTPPLFIEVSVPR